MENQLDNKELAKEYAKFTLKRNWLADRGDDETLLCQSPLMTRGTVCTKRR
jgi:hypothetical protein